MVEAVPIMLSATAVIAIILVTVLLGSTEDLPVSALVFIAAPLVLLAAIPLVMGLVPDRTVVGLYLLFTLITLVADACFLASF